MKIEILCTGDEILSGKTVNTNYSYMAQKLFDFGFSTRWGTVVGDDKSTLIEAIQLASKRAQVVIVNGGLGPTVDDLSQEVAAQAAAVELELNQFWLNHVRSWYASRGRKMPDTNKKQAMLPVGAELIDNPVGTACGFRLRINQAEFYFTPGVPHELKRMMTDQILPRLQKMRGARTRFIIRRFHTFGIGESRADQLLNDFDALNISGKVKLGFQSHYPELETKLMVAGEDEQEMLITLKPLEDLVRNAFGHFIVAEEDETLVGVIERKWMQQYGDVGGKIGVVEMHTAGNVSASLMSKQVEKSWLHNALVIPDEKKLADRVGIQGGFIDFNCPDTLRKLSYRLKDDMQVALLLAVLTRFTQTKPTSEKTLEMVILICTEDRFESRFSKLPGNMRWVQIGACHLALDCLRRFLLGLPVSQRIDFEEHD